MSESPTELKKRLSRALLDMPGVSAVGMPAKGITIYLQDGSEPLRKAVLSRLGALSPAHPVHLEVSGSFQARPPTGKP